MPVSSEEIAPEFPAMIHAPGNPDFKLLLTFLADFGVFAEHLGVLPLRRVIGVGTFAEFLADAREYFRPTDRVVDSGEGFPLSEPRCLAERGDYPRPGRRQRAAGPRPGVP